MRGTRSLLAPVASAAVAVAVAALAAGCGGGTSNSGSTASASSSVVEPTMVTSTKLHSSTPGSPTTAPTLPGGSLPGSKPPLTTGKKATLTGTAVRGAEPGCVGLKTSSGQSYELAGDAPKKLAQGAGDGYEAKLGKVKVTGHFASAGMASHCMMGRIFVVSDLKKLS